MSGNVQAAPSATMQVASGAAGAFPIGFGYYPQEGSRAVTCMYNWAAATGYVEDLSQLPARGVETTIQSAFIDNSSVSTPVTVTVLGTDQVCIIPPLSQGVFPLFFTGTPAFQITTTATNPGVTRVYLLNVPASPAVWSASGGPGGTYQGIPTPVSAGASSGLLLDAYGSLLVDTECNTPTYSLLFQGTPIAGATDVLTLFGVAGKTLRIHQITVNNANASAWFVIRRSSANTGGTSTLNPGVPHDGNSPASSGQVAIYTANAGVLGTSVGIIDGVQAFPSGQTQVWNYGATDQSLVVRGMSQGICINSNGGTPGFSLIKIKWSEV